jgi:hypothetical protein
VATITWFLFKLKPRWGRLTVDGRRTVAGSGGAPPWHDLPDSVFAAVMEKAGLQTARCVYCNVPYPSTSQHGFKGLHVVPSTAVIRTHAQDSLRRSIRGVSRSWRASAQRTAEHLAPRALLPGPLSSAFPNLTVLDLSRCCCAPAGGAPATGRLDPALVADLSRLHRLADLRLGCSPLLPATGAGAGPGRWEGDVPTGRDAAAADAPEGFSHITDDALAGLALSAMQQAAAPPGAGSSRLRSLDLGGCVLVSDGGLIALARLETLRELRLRRCASVSDAGLIAVAQLAGLTRLDAAGCPRVGRSKPSPHGFVALRLRGFFARPARHSVLRRVMPRSVMRHTSSSSLTNPDAWTPSACGRPSNLALSWVASLVLIAGSRVPDHQPGPARPGAAAAG